MVIYSTSCCVYTDGDLFVHQIDREKGMHWLKDEEEEEFTRQRDGCLSTGLSRASPRSP